VTSLTTAIESAPAAEKISAGLFRNLTDADRDQAGCRRRSAFPFGDFANRPAARKRKSISEWSGKSAEGAGNQSWRARGSPVFVVMGGDGEREDALLRICNRGLFFPLGG